MLPQPPKQQQPYRRGTRVPGQVLTSILRGRPLGSVTPKDMERAAQLQAARRKPRATRRPRPPRAPR